MINKSGQDEQRRGGGGGGGGVGVVVGGEGVQEAFKEGDGELF